MAAWATPEQVEASLGRSLTAEESSRADLLVAIATDSAADITGKRYSAGSYVVERVPDSRGRVWVPAPAAVVDVTAVSAVDECDGSATALTVGANYTVRGRVLYGLRYQRVEVAFDVKAGAVPDSVSAVIAGAVAATLGSPPAGVQSQATGDYQVTYINGNTGRVYWSALDRAILTKFADPAPAINLLASL